MIGCNDTINIPLPRYLQVHKDKILHAFDNASGGDYNPKAWQQWFADSYIINDDLNKIIGKCPNKISRNDVRYFASQTHSADYDELRRLFLACMVWGWGKDYKDQRGRRHTQAALSDPRLREMLEKSVTRIKSGQIKVAYEEFKLHGCRSAFFTKFFYFVGKEYSIEPLPLILDSHVANFLQFLGKEEGWDKSIFTKARGYLQYICSVNKWAGEIGCQADNIEYFMYKGDKNGTGIRTNLKEENVGKSKKAAEVKTEYVEQARKFSAANGLQTESKMIDDMDCPTTWNQGKTKFGTNFKPNYWFNRAIVGNHEALWKYKKITGLPAGWTPKQLRRNKALTDYCVEQDYGVWFKNNDNPYWMLPPTTQPTPTIVIPPVPVGTSESIEIRLSTIQKDKLQTFADECDIDISKLVRSWILERLYHLYKE